MTTERIQKSRTEKMLFGVAGGLADYFSVDPVLVRLAFVVACFIGGLGFLLYIVLAIIIPETETPLAPSQVVAQSSADSMSNETPDGPAADSDAGQRLPESDAKTRRRNLLGIILVAGGALFLMSNMGVFSRFDLGTLWPVLLIAAGGAVLIGRFRQS